MSSISLSFLQSSCSYSNLHHQHKLFIQPPSSSQWIRTSLIVEAGARTRQENRKARHVRIRKKVEGTPERPRMCVFRSNKHLYVQVIDDTKMHTLASASTMQKPLSVEFDYTSGPTIVSSIFNKILPLMHIQGNYTHTSNQKVCRCIAHASQVLGGSNSNVSLYLKFYLARVQHLKTTPFTIFYGL